MKTKWKITLVTFISACFWYSCFSQNIGEKTPEDVNDEEIISFVIYLERYINMRRNEIYYSRHVEIHKAESQIGEGILYYLDFTLMQTTCRDSVDTRMLPADQIAETCPIYQNGVMERCTAKIQYRPWDRSIDIIDLKLTRL